MEQFILHFFKKKTREVDVQLLTAHFESVVGFEVVEEAKSIQYIYTHPRLGYKAAFILSKSSMVPDLVRLNPSYLDVNFRLELPLLTPTYVVKEIFQITQNLVEKFHLSIYTSLLEDVMEFKIETLTVLFNQSKNYYKERNPLILSSYQVVSENKATAILRYIDEAPHLQKYYEDYNIFVPKYHILKDGDDNLVLAMEWREGQAIVFPPYLDFVFYRTASEVKVIPIDDIVEVIYEFLENVPGFIKETKVINHNNMKKGMKLMKKTRFEKFTHNFSKEELTSIVD